MKDLAPGKTAEPEMDPWILKFLRHLLTEKGASVYTERNYRQALREFAGWFRQQRRTAPDWNALRRDDFRDFLRFLGRSQLSRAAVQLRFSALRSFYKFLIRHGAAAVSPVRKLSLPAREKRLPRFLTVQQLEALLLAPGREMKRKATGKRKMNASKYFRDAAILEVIYSCGLRVSELCQLARGGRGLARPVGARARQGKKRTARAHGRSGAGSHSRLLETPG